MTDLSVILQVGTMIIIAVVGFYVKSTNSRIVELKTDFMNQIRIVFREFDKKQDKTICELRHENEEKEMKRIGGDVNGVGIKLESHIQAGH